MINGLLKKLDLGDKEIELYLAILKYGKIIPADLAKITGINRTTIYSVADELSRKGFITQDLSGSVKYYMATPPEDLFNLIKKEEKKLEQKKEVIKRAVTELKIISTNTTYPIPKLRFIPDDELGNFFFKQTEKWEKSARETDPCWYGFQDNTFVEYFADYINWYWSRPENTIKLKLYSNKCEMEDAFKKRNYSLRKIKFFSKKMPFTASTMIIGDYIIMVVTKESPYYGIEIKNAELAKNLREIFKLLWTTNAGETK